MTSTSAASSQALTLEGHGEGTTLHLLRQRYRSNHITVEQLLQDHLPHLSSLDALRRAIRAGRVRLQLRRLGDGKKAPQVIHLTDLAAFLDQTKPAATEAA